MMTGRKRDTIDRGPPSSGLAAILLSFVACASGAGRAAVGTDGGSGRFNGDAMSVDSGEPAARGKQAGPREQGRQARRAASLRAEPPPEVAATVARSLALTEVSTAAAREALAAAPARREVAAPPEHKEGPADEQGERADAEAALAPAAVPAERPGRGARLHLPPVPSTEPPAPSCP